MLNILANISPKLVGLVLSGVAHYQLCGVLHVTGGFVQSISIENLRKLFLAGNT
jgi:hypothetical protein